MRPENVCFIGFLQIWTTKTVARTPEYVTSLAITCIDLFQKLVNRFQRKGAGAQWGALTFSFDAESNDPERKGFHVTTHNNA